MRRIIVGAFLSLDGVMQAPGAPEEDRAGGFRYGGWTVPYWDDQIAAAMGDLFSRPFDLLLGRRTYDIFAAHWPYVESDPAAGSFDQISYDAARLFNQATKYVATHHSDTLCWQNSHSLGQNVPAALNALKAEDGPDLIVQGSGELVQQLLSYDLVDELRLLIYPVLLGDGKRLFAEGLTAMAFMLEKALSTPSGVVIAHYQRGGEIELGTFALEHAREPEHPW
ncbi:dihydrofolate reductase [Serratia sp. JUb9]|uniref:dihydrofolate reductase family protein n=1 Tax=Serratia sp. JUb9 TaxID=2724469 RepID=UPI00164D4884|nr:dihydrofolate reductase family protein [Serratia sp. JUb9]QNK30481.1 dihydrofolate reductase [Serratia sp. JUb9]